MVNLLQGEILVTGTDGHPNSSSRCDTWLLNSSRPIRHALVAGYDTNKCVLDKPCGVVTLSSALGSSAQVILVRDATRPQSTWLNNTWFSDLMATNLIESAPWLSLVSARGGIRSTTVSHLAAALMPEVPSLQPLVYPRPSWQEAYHPCAPVPELFGKTGGRVGVVLVSCASDFGNGGFQARVNENLVGGAVFVCRSNASSST